MSRKIKWIIVGYYIDYSGSWTLYESEDGYKSKRVKGIK